MKRTLFSAALLLGFAGAASAQGPNDVIILLNNIDGATNNLVSGLQDTGVAYLNGNITGTFNNFNNTLSGLALDLSHNTPAQPLAEAGRDLGDSIYLALVPLYQALDGPSMQISDASAALRDPLISSINSVDYDLSLVFELPELPGLGDSGDSPIPVAFLDPATLTDLLGGFGGDGDSPIPLAFLDPATLTGLLGGFGGDGDSPIPVAFLDPATLTDLLGSFGGFGGGGDSPIPVSFLDPAILTDLLANLPGLDGV